jgi:hypothetical protein
LPLRDRLRRNGDITLKEPIEEQPIKKVEQEKTIDDVLQYNKKLTHELIYELTVKPSKEGILEYDFGGDIWDLKRFEKNVVSAYAPAYLPAVAKYKASLYTSMGLGYEKRRR